MALTGQRQAAEAFGRCTGLAPRSLHQISKHRAIHTYVLLQPTIGFEDRRYFFRGLAAAYNSSEKILKSADDRP